MCLAYTINLQGCRRPLYQLDYLRTHVHIRFTFRRNEMVYGGSSVVDALCIVDPIVCEVLTQLA